MPANPSTIQLLSILATIGVALFGYAVTYIYNLRLARRKERLDRVTQQLDDFYGPLYITAKTIDTAYRTLLETMDRTSFFDDANPPTPEQWTQHRIWVKTIFLPLVNDLGTIIKNNAHLIREQEMPDMLIRVVAHSFTSQVLAYEWEHGDTRNELPAIAFPTEILDYATRSYKELKHEQLALIGRKS
ncbi:MAG: hypothetical protein HYV34_00365 [Candidatus Kerfeldbacteria bacterium]|nr:hypothetical protein [Candidatus Kerfeldbacteria bacterium]